MTVGATLGEMAVKSLMSFVTRIHFRGKYANRNQKFLIRGYE